MGFGSRCRFGCAGVDSTRYLADRCSQPGGRSDCAAVYPRAGTPSSFRGFAPVYPTILGAPSAVEIAAAEFKSFEWGDHHYQVPGFTIIKTALHAGKWGEAPGVGTVLLAYRAYTLSGAIVLCAATVTSRLVGVTADIQKALLLAMIAATTPAAEIAESIEAIPVAQPASIDEFLVQERELGAAFLLSRLAVADPDLANLTEVASEHLNILLSTEDVSRLRERLPRATSADERKALSRFGWGAYLRRLHPTSELKSEVRTK